MLDTLRAWLNGRRSYIQGVTLYAILGKDARLLALFKSGDTPTNNKRLQDELMIICKQMKAQSASNLPPSSPQTHKQSIRKTEKQVGIAGSVTKSAGVIVQSIVKAETEVKLVATCINPELYAIAKKEADLAYKENMNERATLFAMCNQQGFEDINRPDLVAQRTDIAVGVVLNNIKVSELYDRAEYVRVHGHLPVIEKEEDEYTSIPDHQVKQALDNLRKAYNKMKKREPTADRVARMQVQEQNIKKLEEKWHSLKQAALT